MMFNVRRWFLVSLVVSASISAVAAETVSIDLQALREKAQLAEQQRKSIQKYTSEFVHSYYSLKSTGEMELIRDGEKEGLKVEFQVTLDFDAAERYKTRMLSFSDLTNPSCFTITVLQDKSDIRLPEDTCSWFIETYNRKLTNGGVLVHFAPFYGVWLKDRQDSWLASQDIIIPISARFGSKTGMARYGSSFISLNLTDTSVWAGDMRSGRVENVKLKPGRSQDGRALYFDIIFNDLESSMIESMSGVTIEPGAWLF